MVDLVDMHMAQLDKDLGALEDELNVRSPLHQVFIVREGMLGLCGIYRAQCAGSLVGC